MPKAAVFFLFTEEKIKYRVKYLEKLVIDKLEATKTMVATQWVDCASQILHFKVHSNKL